MVISLKGAKCVHFKLGSFVLFFYFLYHDCKKCESAQLVAICESFFTTVWQSEEGVLSI